MGRCCCIPGCKTGSRSNPVKLSMFRAPSDKKLFSKWEKIIARSGYQLKKKDLVCQRHFPESMLNRDYRYLINGEEVKLNTGKPNLKPDAVPSLCLNGELPVTTVESPKSNEFEVSQVTLMEYILPSELPKDEIRQSPFIVKNEDIPKMDEIPQPVIFSFHTLKEKLTTLKLPPAWGVHVVNDNQIVMSRCYVKQNDNIPCIPTFDTILTISASLKPTVWHNGAIIDIPLFQRDQLTSLSIVEEFVTFVAKFNFCNGAATKDEYCRDSHECGVLRGDRWYSASCTSEGRKHTIRRCPECSKLRVLFQQHNHYDHIRKMRILQQDEDLLLN